MHGPFRMSLLPSIWYRKMPHRHPKAFSPSKVQESRMMANIFHNYPKVYTSLMAGKWLSDSHWEGLARLFCYYGRNQTCAIFMPSDYESLTPCGAIQKVEFTIKKK